MSKLSRVRAFASVVLVAVAIVLVASAPSQARGGGGHGGGGHGGGGHEGGSPSRGEGHRDFDGRPGFDEHHDFGERRDFDRGRGDFSFGDPYYEADPPADGYAAPESWYYCPSYGDYYPNVGSCPDPWVPEPAS
jgi:hypothetical protein